MRIDLHPLIISTTIERLYIFIIRNLYPVMLGILLGNVMQLLKKSDDIILKKVNSQTQIDCKQYSNQAMNERLEIFKKYEQSLSVNARQIIKTKKYLKEKRIPKYLIYTFFREIISPSFSSFGARNLIKKICCKVRVAYYEASEMIINKGEEGEEMYFLLNGKVAIIGSDKNTILKHVDENEFFGEIAIFHNEKRACYVEAETSCCLLVLHKRDINPITHQFPKIEANMHQFAQERLEFWKEEEVKEDTVDPNELLNLMRQLKKEFPDENEIENPESDQNMLGSSLGLIAEESEIQSKNAQEEMPLQRKTLHVERCALSHIKTTRRLSKVALVSFFPIIEKI